MRDTSIEAYNLIKQSGVLSERRFQVYESLFNHGPATASELSEYMPGKVSRTIGSNVHARLCELREMGVVKELETRVCRISGMRVIEWDVTSQMPIKLEKKKSRIQEAYERGYREGYEYRLRQERNTMAINQSDLFESLQGMNERHN